MAVNARVLPDQPVCKHFVSFQSVKRFCDQAEM